MCGRLAHPDDWSELRLALRVDRYEIDEDEESELCSENVAPTEKSPVVFEQGEHRVARASVFGFASPHLGKHVINAKSETVTEKSMFSKALRERRCLVIADAFYEWTGAAKTRQPHYIVVPTQEPFTFAGLYRFEPRPDGTKTLSHVIVTAEAGPVMAELHDREPVIVAPEARDAWLHDPDAGAALERTLATRMRDLVHWEVSRDVNRAGTRGAYLREPLARTPPTPPAQGSLF